MPHKRSSVGRSSANASIIAWAPASGQLWNAIGFHPEKTSLGRLHQRYVRELLN